MIIWFVRGDNEDSAHRHYHSPAGRAARRRPLPADAGSFSFAVRPGIKGLVSSMDCYQEQTETPFDSGALRTSVRADVAVNIFDGVYRATTA